VSEISDAYFRVTHYECIRCSERHPVGQLCPKPLTLDPPVEPSKEKQQ
jgi:hypothetical protein